MTKGRAVALAAVVATGVGAALFSGLAETRTALAQTEAGAIRIAARERTVAGQREGEVLVGNDVVIRLRSAAGGLTASQRAQRVADRLNELVRSGRIRPQNFRVAMVNGQYAVLAGSELIITADPYHAAANGVTPQRLATIWRDNLATAVSAQVAGFRAEQERTSSRIVPIVSLGQGIRVGAARIAGPATRVSEASVVGQIETTFQDVVRIRIFVPLPSVTTISRVPQVNVTAYGDIKL